MRSEMKKLEQVIVETCKGNPELEPIAQQVSSLSGRLDVFDDRLEDILDQITNTPEGDQRTKLKQQAVNAIRDYQTALQDQFFKDVDADNGFTNVTVASTATRSLESIAKVLAAA
jgi:hypothetical protein